MAGLSWRIRSRRRPQTAGPVVHRHGRVGRTSLEPLQQPLVAPALTFADSRARGGTGRALTDGGIADFRRSAGEMMIRRFFALIVGLVLTGASTLGAQGAPRPKQV